MSYIPGDPQNAGDGSILEEYLDQLMVMPVEVKRYTTLMRDLDSGCERDLAELAAFQDDFVNKLREKVASLPSSNNTEEERKKLEQEMKASESYQTLEALRKRVRQKVSLMGEEGPH